MNSNNNKSEPTIKLLAIVSADHVYVSPCTTNAINGRKVWYNGYDNLLFDGKPGRRTYNNEWLEVDALPQRISSVIPAFERGIWVLADGYPVTNATPADLEYDPSDEDSDYNGVSALYEYRVVESSPSGETNIDFELSVLYETDKSFEIRRLDFQIESSILDTISFDKVLLPLRPCKMSSRDAFIAIRNHVKGNINRSFARISSDYDFCFRVEKDIALSTPQAYTVNVGTNKKPRVETRYQRTRTVVMLEIAPHKYQNYSPAPVFEGADYDDMIKNLNEYLEELMAAINAPLVDCPHCQGTGVIEVTK